jgi:hypothetical protein
VTDGGAAIGEDGCDALSADVTSAAASMCAAGNLSLDLITFKAAAVTADASSGAAAG